MANLSELAAPLPQTSVPGWIVAMSASGGFVENGGGAFGEAAPGPPGDAMASNADEHQKEQAFQAGEAAGRAAAEAEAKARDAAREGLRSALARLDEVALQALRHQLAETVAQLCEGVLAPLALDREALMRRVVEAARLLGEAPARCVLHLHPDDIARLDPHWAQDWRINPDPSLPPGGLRLEAPDGAIADGPDEWRRAIAAALMP